MNESEISAIRRLTLMLWKRVEGSATKINPNGRHFKLTPLGTCWPNAYSQGDWWCQLQGRPYIIQAQSGWFLQTLRSLTKSREMAGIYSITRGPKFYDFELLWSVLSQLERAHEYSVDRFMTLYPTRSKIISCTKRILFSGVLLTWKSGHYWKPRTTKDGKLNLFPDFPARRQFSQVSVRWVVHLYCVGMIPLSRRPGVGGMLGQREFLAKNYKLRSTKNVMWSIV